MFLVVIAVICIPVMLCIKPFYLLAKNKRKQRVSEIIVENKVLVIIAGNNGLVI